MMTSTGMLSQLLLLSETKEMVMGDLNEADVGGRVWGRKNSPRSCKYAADAEPVPRVAGMEWERNDYIYKPEHPSS